MPASKTESTGHDGEQDLFVRKGHVSKSWHFLSFGLVACGTTAVEVW
jgi:hypothetical protein